MKYAFGLGFVGLAACASFAAAPEASIVSVDFTKKVPHVVTVTYTLAVDAIVTADVLTNGVSVGGRALWTMGGDVNRRIKASGDGEVRTIRWLPDAGFEGQSLASEKVKVVLTTWDATTPPDYMVVDLHAPSNITYFAAAEAVPGGVQDVRYKSDHLLMRKIPAKNVSWVMGISADDAKSVAADLAQRALLHKVKLTHDYYFSVYQLTVAQYDIVKSSSITSSHLPKNWLNWGDLRGSTKWPQYDADGNFDRDASHAVSSSSWMKSLRDRTGLKYIDYPTEAQFEFAARAGAQHLLPYNDLYTQSNVSRYARWAVNKGEPDCEGLKNSLATVGSYLPNKWGLYDVVGNGFQWCLDWWENWGTMGLDPFTEQVDPVGAKCDVTTYRVVRGAEYDAGYQWGCFLSCRRSYDSGSGYMTCRLALTLY